MKKFVTLVSIAALVVFVGLALAQQKPGPAGPAPAGAPAGPPAEKPKVEKPAPEKLQKFTGSVANVDEAAKTVTVKAKKDEKTFTVDEKTKITRGNKDIALSELKQGMNVVVEYKKDGDKLIAVSIKASAPKAPAKPKEAKPAEAKPAEVKPPEAPKK